MRRDLLSFTSEEDLIDYVQHRVILTEEVTRILGVSRQRLYEIIKTGRLVPLVRGRTSSIFWRPEVEALAKEQGKG